MKQNSKNNKLRGVYDNVMLPNYSPANFVPKKAEGSLVWDQDDKEYIEFWRRNSRQFLRSFSPFSCQGTDRSVKKNMAS